MGGTDRRKPVALVIDYWRGPWPRRRWEAQRLKAWASSGQFQAFYLNLALPYPRSVRDLQPNVIVFDAPALAIRQIPWARARLEAALDTLSRCDAPRVAMPLDEFLANAGLNRLLREIGANLLLSPAPASAWPVIYPGFEGPIEPFLVSYVDEGLRRLRSPSVARRRLWLGYRVCEADPRFGRIGRLKNLVGAAGRGWAETAGLSYEIDELGQRVLRGEAWIRFLANARVTLGVEGGADVIDTQDDLAEAVLRGEAPTHPRLAPVRLRALSPRHLEAAATRTAQVLVEGDYSGVMETNRHYAPAQADLSDLGEALERCRDDAFVQALTERAHGDLIASDCYTWTTRMSDLRRTLGL